MLIPDPFQCSVCYYQGVFSNNSSLARFVLACDLLIYCFIVLEGALCFELALAVKNAFVRRSMSFVHAVDSVFCFDIMFVFESSIVRVG